MSVNGSKDFQQVQINLVLRGQQKKYKMFRMSKGHLSQTLKNLLAFLNKANYQSSNSTTFEPFFELLVAAVEDNFPKERSLVFQILSFQCVV